MEILCTGAWQSRAERWTRVHPGRRPGRDRPPGRWLAWSRPSAV